MENIVKHLRLHAERTPDRKALIFPRSRFWQKDRFEHWTYRELDSISDAYARGFRKVGIGHGTKTIIMLKPGPDLFAVVFALFKVGAIPVIVDPGMGVKRMLHCYRTVRAEAFIGIPLAHVVRRAAASTFADARICVTVGGLRWWGGSRLADIAEERQEPLPIEEVTADETLVINFTTGSTGPARGVEYTHANVAGILDVLTDLYGPTDDVTTLVTLPLFALFDLLLGVTAVLAPMDPTKPARADAGALERVMNRFQTTHMFGSPALLKRLGDHMEGSPGRLSSLKLVVSGGAPVMPSILDRFRKGLSDDARIYATYGATEALPMARIESRELLDETRSGTYSGTGTCAGYPTPGLEVGIIDISDEPISQVTDGVWAAPGAVGEIVVRGPIVSPRYHEDPENNARGKIPAPGGQFHRTGDLGWIDQKGRLWFCGRKAHRVETRRGTLFSVQCEGIFNGHPDVSRTALVGVGPRRSARPVVCVELRSRPGLAELSRIEKELKKMAEQHHLTEEIRDFLFHPGFPVDIRHNAKINREKLADWAKKRVVVDGAPFQSEKGNSQDWLKAIPIAGWAYLLYGVVSPFQHPALRALWLVDIALSVGAHGLQLFTSIPKGREAGYEVPEIVFKTLLYGATFWKFVEPRELLGRNGVVFPQRSS